MMGDFDYHRRVVAREVMAMLRGSTAGRLDQLMTGFDPQKTFYIGIIVIRSGRPFSSLSSAVEICIGAPATVRGDSPMKDILATVPSFIAALTFVVLLLTLPCPPVIR